MPYKIKMRLLELGKKQIDLIPELAKMGIKADPADISNAVNGNLYSARIDKILLACNTIVTEWEKKEKIYESKDRRDQE